MIETGSPAWVAAGWTMLHLIWIGAVVAAIGLALRRALRRSRPEVRYGAALACLAVLSAAPVHTHAGGGRSAGDFALTAVRPVRVEHPPAHRRLAKSRPVPYDPPDRSALPT